MADNKYIPSKAETLAALLTGNARLTSFGATIQRSHRFPMNQFLKMESMARVAGVPMSVIINEVIECGLDAVFKELPPEAVREMTQVLPEQLKRQTKSVSVEVPAKKQAKKPK